MLLKVHILPNVNTNWVRKFQHSSLLRITDLRRHVPISHILTLGMKHIKTTPKRQQFIFMI